VPEPPLSKQLAALLFVATESLTLERLAEAADTTPAKAPAGLTVSELDGKFRLITAPESAGIVRRFLQEEGKNDLTRPALETLAIVAYRGPVTKTQIEQIRGVASETMLRNLLARGLIAEAGKSPEPGRPVRYTISQAFLEHFGLAGPQELPTLPEAPREN
jgi:segregation and condensation protein B